MVGGSFQISGAAGLVQGEPRWTVASAAAVRLLLPVHPAAAARQPTIGGGISGVLRLHASRTACLPHLGAGCITSTVSTFEAQYPRTVSVGKILGFEDIRVCVFKPAAQGFCPLGLNTQLSFSNLPSGRMRWLLLWLQAYQ